MQRLTERPISASVPLAKIRGVLKRLSESPALLLLVSWLAIISTAQAASVQLAWDKNPENNIVAYELSYGTTPGNYRTTLDAGNKTTITVPNLEPGVTYYFVVAARNKAGIRGQKSIEVIHTVPSDRVIAPPNGIISSPNAALTIDAGDRVIFEGSVKEPKNDAGLTFHWDFGADSGVSTSDTLSPGTRRFNRPGTYQVTFTVTNALGVSDPTPAVQTIVVTKPASAPVSHRLWKLKFVDSQEPAGYAATNAFDGDASTFWHTQFTNTSLVKEPHEIQIDMGKAVELNGFQYTPRQDGFNVGNVGRYQFFVSMDGKKWGKAVISGSFENSTLSKQVFFAPKRGRFIRLRSLSEANGFTDANIAEISVFKALKKRKSAPAPAPSAPSHSKTTPAAPQTAATAAAFPDHLAPPAITTEVISGKKYLSLTVAKPAFPDGIQRTIQVSPNLTDWFSGDDHTTVLIDNATTLKVRDNTPISPDEKRFIRLKSTPR